MRYEITAEMNLKNIIAEVKDVSHALLDFADRLEEIEKKYKDVETMPSGREIWDAIQKGKSE